MEVKTEFNVGDEVIAEIDNNFYHAIIDAININIRKITNTISIISRYCIEYEVQIKGAHKRLETNIVTGDKLQKLNK